MDKLNKKLYFAKSFLMLGDAKEHCYNCSYCRVKLDDLQSYHMLPSEVNERFRQVPVAVNLFYCDPLLQVENTVNILHQLEKDGHKGPVVIVTKGDFSLFPDILFDLDLHIAFSTFGVNSIYDGSTMERFENNLKQIKLRKNNYHYSIEFRPICYGINDSEEIFRKVFALAKEYGLAIGYSGLQGKKESVQYWKENNIEACLDLGKCYLIKKNYNNALTSLFGSFVYDLPKSEVLYEIGNVYFNKEDFSSAIYWYELALNQLSHIENGGFVNLETCTILPALQLCVCYDKLGKTEKAYHYHEISKAFNPNDRAVLNNQAYFDNLFKNQ